MLNTSNLLTLAAAGRRLRVPPSWLEREAKAGRIPGVKTGEGWLFHLPTIVRILQRRAIKGENTKRVDRGVS